MREAAIDQSRPVMQQSAAPRSARGIRQWAGDFWLNALFFCARRAPWLVRLMRPLVVRLTIRYSRPVRDATALNARRILGAGISDAQCRDFGRRVVGSFTDFVSDVGRANGWTVQQMRDRIESIEGHASYVRARSLRRGAIVVTAHMGSFELGVAGLRQYENRIHVVFQRDAVGRFEAIRRHLRERLGVIEAPLEQGWSLWLSLRDALKADDVVLIQGDRVLPGQKGERVAFLGHHVVLPTGPVRLAVASGAPIVPIFSHRVPRGKIRLVVEDPIEVNSTENELEAIHKFAAVLGKHVKAHPDQWLLLQPAFCEDTGAEQSTA